MRFKLIVFAVFVLLILSVIYFSSKSSIARHIINNTHINILLVGTDYVDYSYHSDTVILLSYNPQNRFLNIISIPRDTKINLPDIRLKKLNELYTYYYRKSKSHLKALKAIGKVITTIFHNRIEIPYCIRIDYDVFKKLIDALHGIEIEIEDEMRYVDKAGNLHIHLTPGRQILDGEKALQYVRYRTSGGDIGRIYRQQRFIKAIFSKLKKPSTIFYIPNLVKFVFTTELNTEFSLFDIITFMFELKNMYLDNIRLWQLPGKYYYSYWLPEESEISRVVDTIYGPEAELDLSKSKVLVEVCNASSHRGAALEVTRKLRSFGFDVFEYKTWPAKQLKTIIIDRGNLKAAKYIAKILNTDEIFTRYDSKKFVDITVIIGEEYRRD